jgi:hypothetical protein
LLGNTANKAQPWFVMEGFASAYVMVFHHMKGKGVCACAFGKSQMRHCAEDISQYHDPDEVKIGWEKD